MRYVLFILFFSAIVACRRTPTSLPPDGLARYCNDPRHGLVQEGKEENWKVRLAYRPSSLLIAQRYPEKTLPRSEYERMHEYLDDYMHFTLKVNRKDQDVRSYLKQRCNNFDSLWNTLLFGRASDFKLVSDDKVVPCASYEIENRGNVDPALVINLSFQNPGDGDVSFVWRDSLFTLKENVFHFEGLDDTPALKTTTSN